MPSIRIPAPLRSYAHGESEVTVQGESVAEALESLVAQYPNIQPHLFNGTGDLRPFVNLFLDEENVRDLQGLDTRLAVDDQLLMIPSIAGGR